MVVGILVGLGIIILAVLGVLGWAIGTYNLFRAEAEDIRNMWSNIKTEYQRRADLILNLAKAVKSHKKFEKETLIAVVQARSGITSKVPQSKKQDIKNLKGLDGALSRLMLVFEQYPDLKSIHQYTALTDELSNTEDRVNIARTDYNEEVRQYNVQVLTFPNNIIAALFNFKKELYFESEKGVENAPVLDLE